MHILANGAVYWKSCRLALGMFSFRISAGTQAVLSCIVSCNPAIQLRVHRIGHASSFTVHYIASLISNLDFDVIQSEALRRHATDNVL